MRGRRRMKSRRARVRGIAFGVALVLVGAAMLAHVAFDLWGTGIATARAQTRLKAEFRRALAHPAAAGHASPVLPGRADGLIVIPKLNLDMAFVEGISEDALAKGPGHYPKSPMPGRGGNVAIAGHRTTHLSPFWSLDTMKPGDNITLITRDGTFVYRTVWVGVASPNATWVLASSGMPTLTLTTCWPRFSSSHRLVLRAVQVYGRTPHGFIDHRSESLRSWMQPPAVRLERRLV